MQQIKDKVVELTKYRKVDNNSQHGPGFFAIEDLEDDTTATEDGADDYETVDFHHPHHQRRPHDDPSSAESSSSSSSASFTLENIWSTLTFSWMQELLKKGNTKPLTIDDLNELPPSDTSEGVYRRFITIWNKQLKENKVPSLAWSLMIAFGKPFLGAGVLKLFYDSCGFLGPLMLNALIKFLSNPSEPLSKGLTFVFILFFSNFLMSLCLRQYFW